MNIVEKDHDALIRLGYWEFADRYSKIQGPLLEYYKGDTIVVDFVITDRQHPKIDSTDKPYPITDYTIEIEIYDVWLDHADEDEDPIFTYDETNGIEKINAEAGLFRLTIPADDSMSMEYGHHVFYVYFVENTRHRTILKDFIEIIH